MYLSSVAWVVAVSLAGPVPEQPSPEAIRKGVQKALPLLIKGSEGHVAQRTCFACHNQATPMLAFVLARERGFEVKQEHLQKQAKFIGDFLNTNRENYKKGKGQGGQVDMAGYALLSLEWARWEPDSNTAAVVEYLLQRNKDVDHWRTTSNRPPSEASPFATSFVALRGLKKWGTDAEKDRIASRIETVRAWLVKTPGKDTEDRVFRLWALKEAGAEEAVVKDAAQQLIQAQRKDGGWAQLDSLDSDAYATGSVLIALHQTGSLAVTDPAYRRGLAFLLQTQREDGSWLVRSRSRPFQTYFESGFPHGKDQFISMAASGWATAALALAIPAKPAR
jgi:hypothetical protein